MTAKEIVEQFSALGIHLRAEDGRIIARPLSRVPPELRDLARAQRAVVLTYLRGAQGRATVEEALSVLHRLKCYNVPGTRIGAAREIVKRSSAQLPRYTGRESNQIEDPLSIMRALRDIERELIALGSAPDSELGEVIAMVEHTFPCARLVPR